MASGHREKTQDELIAFTRELTAVLTAMAIAERKTGVAIFPKRPAVSAGSADTVTLLPLPPANDTGSEENEWTRLRARAETRMATTVVTADARKSA